MRQCELERDLKKRSLSACLFAFNLQEEEVHGIEKLWESD